MLLTFDRLENAPRRLYRSFMTAPPSITIGEVRFKIPEYGKETNADYKSTKSLFEVVLVNRPRGCPP